MAEVAEVAERHGGNGGSGGWLGMSEVLRAASLIALPAWVLLQNSLVFTK